MICAIPPFPDDCTTQLIKLINKLHSKLRWSAYAPSIFQIPHPYYGILHTLPKPTSIKRGIMWFQNIKYICYDITRGGMKDSWEKVKEKLNDWIWTKSLFSCFLIFHCITPHTSPNPASCKAQLVFRSLFFSPFFHLVSFPKKRKYEPFINIMQFQASAVTSGHVERNVCNNTQPKVNTALPF